MRARALVIAGVLGVLGLLSPAVAQTTTPAVAPASIDAEVAQFRATIRDWSSDIGAILGAAGRDRIARERLTAAMRGLGTEGAAFGSQVEDELERLDAENTRVLKEIIARRGWAALFAFDPRIASQAGIIVVHSPDLAFQIDTLAQYEALMQVGGGPPAHNYATLFDDVAEAQGRPQRFGTNMTCVAGRYVAAPLEEPAQVDARRAAVGLAPMAEYAAQIEQQYGPCPPA